MIFSDRLDICRGGVQKLTFARSVALRRLFTVAKKAEKYFTEFALNAANAVFCFVLCFFILYYVFFVLVYLIEKNVTNY